MSSNPHGYPTVDWLTDAGAKALCNKIRRYWQARGFDVEPYVEESRPNHGTVHSVRSDMAGGMPVDCKGYAYPRKRAA
jgi:hypothetical protein